MLIYIYFILFSLALQPSAGYGPLVSRGFLITHDDAPQSVGLPWTSDQLVAETSTWQHNTHNRQTSMAPVGFEAAIAVRARALGPAIYIYIYMYNFFLLSANFPNSPVSQPSRWLHITLPLVSFYLSKRENILQCKNMTHYTNHKVCDGKHFMSAKLVPE
jgi:hypothetical protein